MTFFPTTLSKSKYFKKQYLKPFLRYIKSSESCLDVIAPSKKDKQQKGHRPRKTSLVRMLPLSPVLCQGLPLARPLFLESLKHHLLVCFKKSWLFLVHPSPKKWLWVRFRVTQLLGVLEVLDWHEKSGTSMKLSNKSVGSWGGNQSRLDSRPGRLEAN